MVQHVAQVGGTAEFPVEWPDPEDAKLTWTWDSNHNPHPLTPLSIDFGERYDAQRDHAQPRASLRGIRPEQILGSLFPHGYWYHGRLPQPDPSAPPDPQAVHHQRRAAELAPRARKIWEEEYLPQIRSTCHQLQNVGHATKSLTELASHLEWYMDGAVAAFWVTQAAAALVFWCRQQLVDFCKEEFGAEGEGMADVMTAGFANESSGSDIDLWKLARRAASLPKVDHALRSHSADELLAVLPQVEGGAQFMEAFGRYLDRYGWRAEIWFELSLPTWQEDPRPALGLLQQYLVQQDGGPQEAQMRAVRQRQQMVRRVGSRLRNHPEKLGQFQALLALTRQYVPVREGRALWQLSLAGSLRMPCLALGEKLRGAGVLDEAEDVFYLRLKELQEIGIVQDGASWQSVVAERKADRAHWMRVTPPATIGGAAPATETAQPTAAATPGRDGEREERVLRGTAASIGVVQGQAKVARTLEEAEKVRKGDILVCRTTSPAWTPLFARVAAVVTEGGGILSHSAIVAREYAIPCVVGVQKATEQIQDGMLITVDGRQGTIRLEG